MYTNWYSLILFESTNMVSMQKARVVRIDRSASNEVATVYFELPQEIFFQEWQFVFLERLDFRYPDGKAMKNAYSIGTTMQLMQEKRQLSTIVKKSCEGGMSEYLTQIIQVGEEIQVTWPLGHFYDKETSSSYLFVSIGSGITPLYAMLQALQQKKTYSKIAFLFGERYKNHIIDEVGTRLCLVHPDIHSRIFLSKDSYDHPNYRTGYVQDGLEEACAFLENTDFQVFLCGKPEMVDGVRVSLQERGIAKERIQFEKY